jgi:hypothetical protein
LKRLCADCLEGLLAAGLAAGLAAEREAAD